MRMHYTIVEFACFVLLLLCLSLWNHRIDGSNRYKIVGTNEEEPKANFKKSAALTATKAIAEVGKTFHYGMIGELNKVKEVNGQQKVGFIMKKVPLIKHLPQLAGFLGGLGTFLWVAFSIVPGETELKYMKKAFAEVNDKLDGLTNSLTETKALVKEYSQKAAYIQAENNIIQAYDQVKSGLMELLNTTCADERDCKQKKMKLVDDFIRDLNVRGDVEMILRGATSNSVFGDSLLELISEGSRCDITRVRHFQSGVASLVAKGGAAVMFHDMFTKNNYDVSADLKEFQKLLYDLEKKKESVIFKCYPKIHRYLVYDVHEHTKNAKESSLLKTNENIVRFLSLRYPWIPFYVVTVKSNENQQFETTDALEKEINEEASKKETSLKNYIFIGSNSRVENDVLKTKRFQSILNSKQLYNKAWFQYKYHNAMVNFKNAIREDVYLRHQLRASLIVTDYEDIIVGYKHMDDSVKQVNPLKYNEILRRDLMVYQQCRKNLMCDGTEKPVHIFATVKTVNHDTTKCTKDCSSNGNCFSLPHSRQMICKCFDNYYGEVCNISVSDGKLALDLSKLMDISFKIPSLLDVSLQLQDVKVALQADIGDIRTAIQTMDKRLSNIFATLEREMVASFDWHGLIAQYGQIVRDLKYYYYIFVEKDDVCPIQSYLQIHKLKCNFQEKFITQEKKDLANVILQPNELRRQLHYLNYLFMGRHDMSLISHRPLLFQAMDKHKKQICSTGYKHTLDKVYKQILLLQFQGYIVWAHALKFLNRDTSSVVERYKIVMEKQKKFYDSNTCKIKIKNTVNFENCTNGYYLYSGMKTKVKCKENFYLTKSTSFKLFVDSVVSVSSELSRKRSSAGEIEGLPDVYPAYGNSAKAWSPAVNQTDRQQFIEVSFKDPLQIKGVIIYETFHGGAVYKIEGLNKFSQWKTLWTTTRSNLRDLNTARKFEITFETLTWSTSKLKVWIDPTVSGQAFQIDAIQIKGTPVEGTCSWYESMSCSPCACDDAGSSSLQCSRNGKCSCKADYKGIKCTDKDCVMEQWSAWSTCNCGPGQTQNRKRSIRQSSVGRGKACGETTENKSCFVACVCGEEEWGDFCEHKHCLVSTWGQWSVCPHQPRPHCEYETAPTLYVHRKRQITRNKQGEGRACPKVRDRKECPKPRCIYLMPY